MNPTEDVPVIVTVKQIRGVAQASRTLCLPALVDDFF